MFVDKNILGKTPKRKKKNRKNNRNKVSNNIFKGIGDMNVVAVPRKNGLLKNLQHITSPEATWDAESYLDFYKKNNIPII